jgi:hypothetical protein
MLEELRLYDSVLQRGITEIGNLPSLRKIEIRDFRNKSPYDIRFSRLPSLEKFIITGRYCRHLTFDNFPKLRKFVATHTTRELDMKTLKNIEVVALGNHAGGGKVFLPDYLELAGVFILEIGKLRIYRRKV